MSEKPGHILYYEKLWVDQVRSTKGPITLSCSKWGKCLDFFKDCIKSLLSQLEMNTFPKGLHEIMGILTTIFSLYTTIKPLQ